MKSGIGLCVQNRARSGSRWIKSPPWILQGISVLARKPANQDRAKMAGAALRKNQALPPKSVGRISCLGVLAEGLMHENRPPNQHLGC
jgi:hypothetical protein